MYSLDKEPNHHRQYILHTSGQFFITEIKNVPYIQAILVAMDYFWTIGNLRKTIRTNIVRRHAKKMT